MYTELTTIHEQVRAYVEEQLPGYAVTSIHGYTTATYESPPQPLVGEWRDLVLFETDIYFKVEAIEKMGITSISCEVSVAISTTGDATLFLTGRALTSPYPSFR